MVASQVPQRVEPIRKSVVVARPVAEAFALFTQRMVAWWPVATHSIYESRAADIVLEPRVGGEVCEVSVDGERSPWGQVLVWDPPHRLVLTWHPGQSVEDATEVEVRFADSSAGTRIELEHRGWERLVARFPKARTSYDSGWQTVLAAYVAAGAGGVR